MVRQRSKKISESRGANQDTKLKDEEFHDFNGSDASDEENVEMMDRDEEEDELEKLVFGDSADFMQQVEHEAQQNLEDISEGDEEEGNGEESDADEGLEAVDDADLFFLDAGPSGDSAALMPIAQSGDEKEELDAPAWDDSDDDKLMVSIATNSRLRKLRTFEGEDLISGREYTKRLRQQFQRLNPPPEWATTAEPPAKRRRRSSASSNSSNSDGDMDMDENLSAQPLARLLQTSTRLTKVSTKRGKLRPEVISIQRMKDIGEAQPSAVTSLQFHPKHPVILSAGLASTLYLHHISPTSLPTPNPQLMSVHVKHTPIHTSAFLGPTGDRIVFSGRRRYFHTWDLETGTIQKVTQVYGHQEEQRTMERFKLSPCGRFMGLVSSSKKGGGIVNILDAHTTQWIAAARIEGRQGLADFAWWSDGEGLTIAGKGGEVGEYSMESKSFLALWQDDGAVGTSVLTLGGKSGQKLLGGDRWVVIGSSSGIVNIYDRKPWAENSVLSIPKRPEPTKVLKHLTTPVSHLHIRPDGQLLVMASRWKKDALRLVHLPSCTVYRNWPTSQTPLGRISAVAFSPDNDMLAVGNEQGKVKLWEIRD